jgi:Tfp pilus assembly protein PilF
VTAPVKNEAAYHYQMGVSHLAEGNNQSALIELAKAERLDPENPELLHYLGMAYFRKGKFELAEEKYLKAIQLKPDYTAVRNELGVDYLEMRRWDDAINQLKLVTDDIFFPDQAAANINLGLAYYGKGDFNKALNILRAAVVSNPSDPRARLHLGKVYFALDKIDLAINEYRKAIDIVPEYANAYYHLALAQLKNKDTASALTSFAQVIRIAPDTEIGHLSREHLDTLK